jgi:hypothetical protein
VNQVSGSSLRRVKGIALAASVGALWAGCSGGGESVPSVTGDATEFSTVEELRDAYVAAGGTCEAWEEIDPGDYDAKAGRCSDSVVMAVYANPDELAAAVDRSKNLAVQTHLLVGENWLLNVDNPQDFVDALGGTTVS